MAHIYFAYYRTAQTDEEEWKEENTTNGKKLM